MTTISRGASNTDRSIATMTSQTPRTASGARSPRFEPLPRTLNPRVSPFGRGPWAEDTPVAGGLWILQRDEDSIDRSGLLTV